MRPSVVQPCNLKKLQIESRSLAANHSSNHFSDNGREFEPVSRAWAGDDHLGKFRMVIENKMFFGSIRVHTH